MSTSKPHGASSPKRAAKRGGTTRPTSLHSKGTRSKQKLQASPAREFLLSLLSCTGVLLGLIVSLTIVGVYIACLKVSDVLERIGEYKYSEQFAEIDSFSTFFSELDPQVFKVTHDRPQIVEGRTTYFWQVHILGTDEVRSFEWEHILAQREVNPLTGPALLLSIELGFVSTADAPRYHQRGDIQAGGFEFDPGDPVARAILDQDLSQLNLGDLSNTELDTPEDPVMGPLITTEEAKQRQGGNEEEEDTSADEASNGEAGVTSAIEETEVETGAGESEPLPPAADEPAEVD